MASEHQELTDVVEKVAGTFEQFKQVYNDQLDEQEKKHEARAKELGEALQKISNDLDQQMKDREIARKKLIQQQERIEMLEALQDRPRMSMADKAKNEVTKNFLRCLRGGFQDLEARRDYKESLEKAVELKAVTIGTAGDGGYAVPEEISRSIDALLLKLSDIAAAVKNVQTGTSDYKELITIHGTTSSWAAETGTRSETGTATLRERTPTWGELYAYPKASTWSLEDMFFDVQNWLVNDASEGMSQAISAAIYNGNGTAKPTGMFNGAPTSNPDYGSPFRGAESFQYVPLTNSSPIAVTADDIIDLTYTLNRRYRSNAKFMMNTVTQGYVRKLKDSNGAYLWQPSLQAGQPDLLLGKPVGTWEDLADPTTGNGFPVLYGDFNKAYVLVTRTGMMIDREGFTTPGYVKFYMRKRYGGILLNNDALKVLKVAAS